MRRSSCCSWWATRQCSVRRWIGWAIWRHGWLTLLYAALLFLLFDAKARREERWLLEKFPSYSEYKRRVRKLVPFLY